MKDTLHIPKIGLIIIGDEILSGLRLDKHLGAVVQRLTQRGLFLSWVQIVGDDREFLVDTFKRSFASDHIVLCCGGIGATPDDHTRQAVSQALKLPISRHAQAVDLILERCAESGQEADEFRLRMADFPVGATLIPNPYNKIAGFSCGNHHFVPGFPVMAWPMIEWVLDAVYPHLQHQVVSFTKALRLFETPEAQITPIMELVESMFLNCKLYSLPSVGDAKMARHIELGVKARGGPHVQAEVQAAFDLLLRELNAMNCKIELL